MSKKFKVAFVGLLLLVFVVVLARIVHGHNIAVLNPQGPIAHKERGLLIFGVLLSLIVVVPVFGMTFFIAWKYRESNKQARYTPNWDHNVAVEATWWGIPFVLILVLSIITWNSSHALDPFKPISSTTRPLTIQVVALQWKWLFIYPVQRVATVNFLQIPVNTPVNFEITSDAPMNSFWIPSLGGQIYAMNGMSTQLHLEASAPGNYNGSSANISGKGFAGMKFVARAGSRADFDTWLRTVRQSPNYLSPAVYNQIAAPSENNVPMYFSSSQPDLYDSIVLNFIVPSGAGANYAI